jgi:hypothetical protein
MLPVVLDTCTIAPSRINEVMLVVWVFKIQKVCTFYQLLKVSTVRGVRIQSR